MQDNQLQLAAAEARMTEAPVRVLCIEPDEAHLADMEKALSKAGYEVLCTMSGGEAITILSNHPGSADIILMNHHFGDMPGIEALQTIKKLEGLQRTPVIVQTEKSSPEEAAACIEAGAYYYINKPYKPEVLRSIVRAAAREFDLNRRLHSRVEKNVAVLGFAQAGEFAIRSLKDARELAAYLAQFAPDPSRAVVGLTALMINAIEHGNLNIGHERKNKLLTEMCWQREVERLLDLPNHAAKYVRVTFSRQPDGAIEVRIRDEGSGFDWQRYMDFDPRRMSEPGGRGIARAVAMNPGCVQYTGSGSEVVFTMRVAGKDKPASSQAYA